MTRKRILPRISDITMGRLIAEKSGQEDGLERGVQLDLGVIFTEIVQKGKSARLDEAEARMNQRRDEWLREFRSEQPAFFDYLDRLNQRKMAEVFHIVLQRTNIDTETVALLTRNLGRIAGDQILDIAYMLYEGLHTEAEATKLNTLWDSSALS